MVEYKKSYIEMIGYTQPMMRNLIEVLKRRGAGAEYEQTLCANRNEAIINLAGKVCYASDNMDNLNVTKTTASHEKYLYRTLYEHRHWSIAEHINAVFYIEGVSIVFLKEVTRHRHMSFSVRSGRYVRRDRLEIADVEKPEVLKDKAVVRVLMDKVYKTIEECHVRIMEEVKWSELSMHEKKEITSFLRRILPEGQTTEMVISGNLRAWKEVIDKRDSSDAEVEIRTVARIIREKLHKIFPNVIH